MNKINKNKLVSDFTHIPEKIGTFCLTGNDKALFYGKSGNLQKRIKFLLTSEDNRLDWIGEVDSISYDFTPDFWTAMVKEKLFLEQNTPTYQNRFRITDNYTYLGINYSKEPYISVKEDTQKDEIFVGPFRSRFELIDIIDNFKILKALGNEISQNFVSDDWFTFINDWILNFPKEKISEIVNFIDTLEDDLEFEKAEVWKQRLDFLRKYYDYLTAFVVVKKLNHTWKEQNADVNIENGLIESITPETSEASIKFNNREVEYRESETLAIEKSQFDEMWIILKHLEKFEPEFYQKFIDKEWISYREHKPEEA